MNKLYTEFYKQRIFTLDQARKIIKNVQVCKNTLTRLIKSRKIKRVAQGLYYIVPIDEKEFYPDKIHIASKLRKDNIIGCNSALTVYKLYRPENTIYILNKYSIKNHIKDIVYKTIKNIKNIGIEKIEYKTSYITTEINITDIERTIIDCLWNKTIKIDELITAIRIAANNNIKVNINKILTYLEKYNKPILYNKVGLILEFSKEKQGIQEEELEKIHKKLKEKTFYAKEQKLSLTNPRYKYYGKWNIMIPEETYNKYVVRKE